MKPGAAMFTIFILNVTCPMSLDPEPCANAPSRLIGFLSEHSSRQLPPPLVNVGGGTSQTGFSVTILSSGF